MAQLTKTELQAEIDALAPLVTLAQLHEILTDFVDSFTAGIQFIPYDSDTNLTEGDNNIEHNLNLLIYDLVVFDTIEKTRYKPDFVATDENNINIIWAGDTLNSPEIYFFAKQA